MILSSLLEVQNKHMSAQLLAFPARMACKMISSGEGGNNAKFLVCACTLLLLIINSSSKPTQVMPSDNALKISYVIWLPFRKKKEVKMHSCAIWHL